MKDRSLLTFKLIFLFIGSILSLCLYDHIATIDLSLPICNAVALYIASYIHTYHISLVIIISIMNTLRWHPFDWYFSVMSHFVIVITIDVSSKTKICYFDCKIFVYPNN